MINNIYNYYRLVYFNENLFFNRKIYFLIIKYEFRLN